MFKHDLKIALRNLLRSKLFTSINIIGLSLGISVFLSLVGYVKYQLSFDKFYENGDRIYRIDYFEYQEQEPVLQTARTHDRTAFLVREYFPEVEAVARFYYEKAYIFNENVRLVDQDMMFADSSFFKVFPVKMIQGSPETALIPPNAVVISQSQAEAYFGKENPMGKTLFFNERLPIIVNGVFEDLPENSSLDFDFLVSWNTMVNYGWTSRDGSFDFPGVFTFLKLKEGTILSEKINESLSSIINDHNMELANRRHTARQALRPYEDLHISSGLSGELKPGVNLILLYSLTGLAVFILVAAWINYVNLSLAKSIERAGEIGVRKVLGATRAIISIQFLLEALLLSITTFLIGFMLFNLFTGPLSGALFGDMVFETPETTDLLLYLLIFVSGTSLAAFYPARFISRFNPVLILNNKIGSGKSRAQLLHQGLMVFQLFLAIAVVGITLMATTQISFMKNFDSGFDAGHTISLRGPASTNSDALRLNRYRAFRNEVMQNAGISMGTASMNIPGEEIRYHDEGIRPVGSVNEKKNSFWVMWVDEGYQETFGMKLLGGRNFNAEEKENACMINETGARALGYTTPTDAVNTRFVTQDDKIVTIVGVWKDYHQESLRKPVGPVVFYFRHPHEYGYYSFRVNSREGDVLASMREIWKKHYPHDTFSYYFMDSFFAEQYRSDQLFAKLLNLFSVISISVACLGLFGMATLSMVKRTKEIGIRKVLGASALNIVTLVSGNYIKLIGISCLIAFPVSYYLTAQWLNGFSYRIEIEWWMVVVPGITVLTATLLTIGTQSIRAALANPVKSLKEQ